MKYIDIGKTFTEERWRIVMYEDFGPFCIVQVALGVALSQDLPD